MPSNLETFKESKNKKFFIETGCYLGDGINNALSAGYENIISIEIAKEFKDICMEKFNQNKNVTIILGDSCEILFDVIKKINDPITFWLDGHFSGGSTGFGKFEFPLIQELGQIEMHPIKTHTIMIDDMRLFKDKNTVLIKT